VNATPTCSSNSSSSGGIAAAAANTGPQTGISGKLPNKACLFLYFGVQLLPLRHVRP
jgi:hypothetical protein